MRRSRFVQFVLLFVWPLVANVFGIGPHLLVLADEVANRVGTQSTSSTVATTGSVRGTVTYAADPQQPWRLGRYYIRKSRTGELSEAVVAITDRGLAASDAKRTPATITIDQKNFQFEPEVVSVRAGDKVRFLNSDNQTHNVRTSHAKQTFNVTMPVGGTHEEVFGVASGIRQPYEIGCVFHSSMRAWVFVFDHSWSAVTGKDGAFELQEVPPGEHQLEVVHAAGKLRKSETIEVIAGQITEVQIRLSPKDLKD
ncbi:MAG: carboxypeptidase regulatory-like domain-containing protein [Pirellulaceae bacterium]